MNMIERGYLKGSGYGAWMDRRETIYCDSVDPVHIEFVDGENVVWARRAGISDRGFFDFYHIGCDHLGAVPHGESEIQTMLGCSALQKVLKDSADLAAHELFNIDQVLPAFTYESEGELYLDEDGEEIARLFVFEALAKTIEEPEICRGNIRSGLHAKPILGRMLGGIADPQIDAICDALHYQGVVIYNDPLVSVAT